MGTDDIELLPPKEMTFFPVSDIWAALASLESTWPLAPYFPRIEKLARLYTEARMECSCCASPCLPAPNSEPLA